MYKTLKSFLIKFLPLLVGLILVYITLNAVPYSKNYPLQIERSIYIVIGVLILAWLPNHMKIQLSERTFLSMIFLVYLCSRALWITIVPTLPASDFATYDILARAIAEGTFLQENFGWYIQTYSLGFPLVLGFWYTLLGGTLWSAKAFNILLGLISLLLIYKIGKQMDERVGRWNALLFVLWPAQMAYSSVLGSEHLALALLLAAFYCLVQGLKEHRYPLGYFAVGGGYLALGYATRSALIVGLLAGIFVIVLSKQTINTSLKQAGSVILGFSLIYGLYLTWMTINYHITPISQGYSTLLSGTNFGSIGGWNEKDGLRYGAHETFEEANAWALRKSISRITSRPLGFIRLMVRKIPRTWSTEYYGAGWSKEPLGNLLYAVDIQKFAEWVGNFSQYYHVIVLVFAAVACFHMSIKGDIPYEFLLIVLILAGAILLHCFFESQPRYHFVYEPLLFILATDRIIGK